MTNRTKSVVHFEGRETVFALNDMPDEVQPYLARGVFYELEQLIMHRKLIPVLQNHIVPAVIDVGANIGNHCLFYALHTSAQKIYCFEPNPVARELLKQNVELNHTAKINLQFAEYGCGKQRGRYCLQFNSNNLSATSLASAGPRSVAADVVEVIPLDELFSDEPISLVKIDAEGMEMDVLEGAKNILARNRPAIGLEISNENISCFWQWCDTNQYHVIQEFRMYWDCTNYICVSKRSR